MTRWTEVARAQAGSRYGRTYADRFAAIAAEGGDVHGEGRFVLDLRPAPATVLDAGCGTGRVAAYLVGEGYDVVGVDVDEEMLRVAREDLPDLDWRLADLATLDLGRTFDVVLLAGNIIPLLEPGTLDAVAGRLVAHAAPDGVVVAGFGLDAAHLPARCPVTPLADYDRAMAAAGAQVCERYAGWAREPWDEADPTGSAAGYAVSVHGRTVGP